MRIFLALLLLTGPFFTKAAETFVYDGWNSPFFFSDPGTGTWSLLNPCYPLWRDSLPNLQTTYIGPFKKGNSLSGMEIAWPVGHRLGWGLLLSGSGEYSISLSMDQGAHGTIRENYNPGIMGGSLSTLVGPSLYAGSSVLLVMRNQSGTLVPLPAMTGGLLFTPTSSAYLGISSGWLSGIPSGGFAIESDSWISTQLALRLWKDKIMYSGSLRASKGDHPQVQNSVKVWAFQNAAVRLGYDPAGWNIGTHIWFSAANHSGFLEYYLGKGLYHHVHLTLELRTK